MARRWVPEESQGAFRWERREALSLRSFVAVRQLSSRRRVVETMSPRIFMLPFIEPIQSDGCVGGEGIT